MLEVVALRATAQTVKLPTRIDLQKPLVAEIKSIYPWYYNSSKPSPHPALSELRTAWNKCFKKGLRQHKLKNKGRAKKSFYREQATKAQPGVSNDGKRIKPPKIGWVRLCETLPITTAHNCVISRTADRWFIAVRYEI
jgi:putative transposase